MIYYDNDLRIFSSTNSKDEDKNNSNQKRIGTLSIGILTRKKIRDRKGRVRRVRVEFEAPLMSGAGDMTAVSAISNLKKALGGLPNRSINLNQKSFRKIIEAFKINK